MADFKNTQYQHYKVYNQPLTTRMQARLNGFFSPALCYRILRGMYVAAPLMLTFTDGFKCLNESMMERADRQK